MAYTAEYGRGNMIKKLFTSLWFVLVCGLAFAQTMPHVTGIRPVANIAALRDLKPTATDTMAIVAGYLSTNDGGGGTFYFDPTSTATDDAGIIIAPTGYSTGRWIRATDRSIDVRWFGAKGDGATDDRESIQAAIDYCLVVGKELYISAPNPGKWYQISSIYPGVVASSTGLLIKHPTNPRRTLTIRGSEQDRAYASQLGIRAVYAPGSGPWSLIRNEQDSIKMENLTISGGDVAVGIQDSVGPFKTYKNVTCFMRYGNVSYCLHIPSTWVSTIEGCLFTGAATAQVYVGAPTTSLTISHSYAVNAPSTGNDIGWYIAGGVYSSLINCAADNLQTGYYFDGGVNGLDGISLINCGSEDTFSPVVFNRTEANVLGFWSAQVRGPSIISQTGTAAAYRPILIDGNIRPHWSAAAIASWTTSLRILGGASNWTVRDPKITRGNISWGSVTLTDRRTTVAADSFKGFLANTATGTQLVIPFAGEVSDYYTKEITLSGVEYGVISAGAPRANKQVKGVISFSEFGGNILVAQLASGSVGISSIATDTNRLLINLSDAYTAGINLSVDFQSSNNRWYVDYASSSFCLK